ncbi:hypothetical protein [Sphingobacterium sp. LRF_L2]|uniref:hypothetical protein n=1 Tax=Sphingobacterium sp. LRF_L2 TaxID=3369421 RepID=UPI003F5FC40F
MKAISKSQVLIYIDQVRELLESQFPEVKDKTEEELFEYFFTVKRSRSMQYGEIISEEELFYVRDKFRKLDIPVFDHL